MFNVLYLLAGKHGFKVAFKVFDLNEEVEIILRARSTLRVDSLFTFLLTGVINTVAFKKLSELATPYHKTFTKLLSSCVL